MVSTPYKVVLFLDRDGVVVKEDQVDSYGKIIWIPGVFGALKTIADMTDLEFVMVSNQDGVGTPSFPMNDFLPVHRRIVSTLEGEGIVFSAQHIDLSLPADNCTGRKPGIGMLSAYTKENGYDMEHSLVIGDRLTDVVLAKNLGCRAILFAPSAMRQDAENAGLGETLALVSNDWRQVASFITGTITGTETIRTSRTAEVKRMTAETRITLSLNLDGRTGGHVHTGLPFFDHMLSQIVRHSGWDMDMDVQGDIDVDEHHTVEDTALVLGQACVEALGDKRGISRYGFEILTMDEVRADVALDFSGRPYFVWDATFAREYVGTFPTELVEHFFKSFSDAAKCNLHISVTRGNTHHQIEAIFKAFARALRKAVKRYPWDDRLPSTKGVL
ncbi:imidazoleglycerol-phosphate dehydratase HisB [Parasphaerochaeta coccoides]|uniref:Histidine biosynthesis bifunctional protein HisB n=1 Tax=Parasphaerochaeta coccoides (strain ATCC BAA-1237 / DSM 17374 / SPN1) TaxID=760011 RepID=F4GI30_PARC1|nr:imidazoleglycerol-phosphate dehydratase HisB [Parasphaerochaeta coccoides]AEC02628.1 Imidazoleglycerol-phosphate dehydratase [Parasphaerochaeta coccoides DSM 17374]